MTPESILSLGLISGRGGAGDAPDPSCIELNEIGADWVKIEVIPPADPTDYSGTKILYGAINTCTYSEAGPEDAQDIVTIVSLTAGTIYVFVPVAFGPEGALAKPGNAILATVPVNLINMGTLELNSCGLEDVWRLIAKKIDASGLRARLAQLDSQLLSLSIGRESLLEQIDRLKAQVYALERKL